ncbi:hypothetical protein [Mesobacillus maritimus]|uniref:hypothetical protein n=1 Tax=Mesobacillus maritimus TaxID=1643336 RepID=UPI003850FE22
MEFLFENPLFIFILIGIISSLFKRVKGEQEQQPKRPVRPEQQGPTWNSEDQMPAEPEPLKPMRTQPSIDERLEEKREFGGVPENPFLDIQKKYEERRRENENKQSPRPNNLQSRTVVPTIQVKDQSVQGVSVDLSPEPDRVIEGIAWAQVLGEPRSRNPHRTMRRK